MALILFPGRTDAAKGVQAREEGWRARTVNFHSNGWAKSEVGGGIAPFRVTGADSRANHYHSELIRRRRVGKRLFPLVLAIAALSIVRVRAREFASVTISRLKPLKSLDSRNEGSFGFYCDGFGFRCGEFGFCCARFGFCCGPFGFCRLSIWRRVRLCVSGLYWLDWM
jgi:hypothetical protein